MVGWKSVAVAASDGKTIEGLNNSERALAPLRLHPRPLGVDIHSFIH